MTAGAVGALFVVWAIAVASPGPDLAVVLQRALAGRRHGLAAAAGVVAGITVWIVAAFAGLAAVLRVQPGLMTGLQVAGGLLLATVGVLGVSGWLRARDQRRDERREARGAPVPSADDPVQDGDSAGVRAGVTTDIRGDVLRGLATNLSNPKALVFFGAVLAPFLRGDLAVGRGAALVAGMVAVALVWFWALAMAASHPAVHARIERWLPWVDLVVSGLFVALGVAFVVAAVLGSGSG